MTEKDRIWVLMARKLTGEASPEEIAELERFQQQHPESTYSLQVLADLWRSRQCADDRDPEAAFNRHLTRMALRDIQSPGDKAARLSLAGSRPVQATMAGDSAARRSDGTFSGLTGKAGPFAHARDLFDNYFKIAWRSLLRNKGFTAINISGLAIGLASAIVLLLWVRNELSYDQFHKNRDRVYQVMTRSPFDGHIEVDGKTPQVLAPVLRTAYHSEIETVVRMNWVGAFILSVADKHIGTQGYLTDAGFFRLFSFPLLEGDTAAALAGPRSIVLTQRLAKKLFGNADALGRTVSVDSTHDFVVSAVMKDQPPNTTFTFEYLIPWSYTKEVHWEEPSWKKSTIATYVLLRPGVTGTDADKRLSMVIRSHEPSLGSAVFLHPMRKWRLYSNFVEGKATGGEINFVRMLAIIAAFILLIACINYMNLGTARSIRRARETGIRKVVGAGRGSLISRFLGESVLIAVLAGVVALGIVMLALPWFNRLIETGLSIPYGDPLFWLAGVGFVVFTGLLAGSYPAFYLSAFRPVNILRGHFRAIHALITPRRILVVFQFTFAITFIICTIVMYREFYCASHRDAGYDTKGLAFVFMKGEMGKNYPAIRRDLMNSGAITDITRTNAPIGEIWSSSDAYEWPGKNPKEHTWFIEYRTDRDFTSTMGLRLLAGRDIDAAKFPSDSSAILLTSEAAKTMGFADPLGQRVRNNGNTYHVVGVVGDFVTGTLFNRILPIVIQGPTSWFGALTVRFNPQTSPAQNKENLASVIKRYNPNYPFEYFFVDDYVAAKMQGDAHFGTLAALFAGMAIFISCLGLFGLSAYMAESRLREIGVRKVLGASIMRLTALLSKDFLVLVLIAFAIASPLAWWCMRQWLDGIPYHIGLNWWIFAFTGLLSLCIAAGTVGFQAVKAALTNPALVLRMD
ncbi:MAG TPA: ABC transporter permease [Puia sp.]|nr:ABC transporter permease [Puia sp.]